MDSRPVSKQTLQRLPLYLSYLRSAAKDGASNISATAIADALGLNDVQVRKDLASVSSGGRPKVGYVTGSLISDIERFLGYGNSDAAVIVGAGNLGRALLSYDGFEEYGLNIIAAFDSNEDVAGTLINGKPVMPEKRLGELCRRMNVKIGIIAVPAQSAQGVCDTLVENGVLAILNCAPTHLRVPENVLVQDENMAISLALLSKHLNERLHD